MKLAIRFLPQVTHSDGLYTVLLSCLFYDHCCQIVGQVKHYTGWVVETHEVQGTGACRCPIDYITMMIVCIGISDCITYDSQTNFHKEAEGS